jgi:hypothetical protein
MGGKEMGARVIHRILGEPRTCEVLAVLPAPSEAGDGIEPANAGCQPSQRETLVCFDEAAKMRLVLKPDQWEAIGVSVENYADYCKKEAAFTVVFKPYAPSSTLAKAVAKEKAVESKSELKASAWVASFLSSLKV